MAVEHRSVEPLRAADRFDLYYRRCYASTLAVVLALRGPRVGVEEVVQEAFLRAFARWDEVGAMDRPDLWVQRVALNLASSQLRRLGAEARALARLEGRREPVTGGSTESEGFWRLVRRLPRGQAAVVALHYAGDLPVTDVAAVLGVPPGTVKSRLHAARQRLARQLEVEEGGDG